jgi:hypothetical protein
MDDDTIIHANRTATIYHHGMVPCYFILGRLLLAVGTAYLH